MTPETPETPDAATETVFETSGSTGAPQRWWRTHDQLRSEVGLVAARMIGEVDHVISYAPPRHLFGALFGTWLPRMRGVPVVQAWSDPLDLPPVPAGARVLAVCVPMAWDLLRRNWRRLERATSVVALHSSAAPPPAAYELVRDAGPRLAAHEILGSTETGAVAHRALRVADGAGVWRSLPDVTLVRDARTEPGQAEPLVVRGPRLARRDGEPEPPGRWATADLVEFAGPDTFRLIGRENSLVKVNGVRVHLSRVERRLGRALPGADFASVALSGDRHTGEGYAVFWAGRERRPGTADIRRALRGLPGPSQIVEVPRIPTAVDGTPDRRALAAAHRPRRAAR